MGGGGEGGQVDNVPEDYKCEVNIGPDPVPSKRSKKDREKVLIMRIILHLQKRGYVYSLKE